MNKPLALAGVALVFSLASLFLSLRSGSDEDPASGAEPAAASTRADRATTRATPGGGDSDVGLRRRVAALEAEVAALRRGLPAASGSASPVGALASASASERAPAEEALLQAIEDDPEVRERLEDLVSESLKKQDERRWQNRRTRWEERAQERLDELAEKASLRPEQVTKLSAMLSAEREEMSALFQKAREEGGGWREMREQLRELRERTDENARAVLDDEQLPAYEAMREEDRPGRGRRGRNRDRSDERRERSRADDR